MEGLGEPPQYHLGQQRADYLLRDYYWATVGHLVTHPEVPRLDFFLFVLVLPDFPVKPYTVEDTPDEYDEVSKADRRTIYRRPYKFSERCHWCYPTGASIPSLTAEHRKGSGESKLPGRPP